MNNLLWVESMSVTNVIIKDNKERASIDKGQSVQYKVQLFCCSCGSVNALKVSLQVKKAKCRVEKANNDYWQLQKRQGRDQLYE